MQKNAIGVDELLAALKAVAEPTRLRILALLAEGELTVTELTQILRQSQPRVSRHLKLLCEAGVLNRFREGTWVFYRLAPGDGIGQFARELLKFLPEGDHGLHQDEERLMAVRQARSLAANEYFDRVAGEWGQIRSLHIPEEEVEKRLSEIIGPDAVKSLVDVGTGTGRMLELFANRAENALGIDMNREMLAVARANIERNGFDNCQVRQGDMYGLPLPDESADLVIFHQVLHYADDPMAAISEGGRILRAGGRIVVVDFAPHEMEFLRDVHAHRRLGFSEEEVVRWFEAVHLEPKVIDHLKGQGDKLTVSIWVAQKKASAGKNAAKRDRVA